MKNKKKKVDINKKLKLKTYYDPWLLDIYEARDYEGADKISDRFERDIFNWTRNEKYPSWSKDEIKEVQKRFGNVPVGTVFRGFKINTSKELIEYESLQNGGYITFNSITSSTPDYDTAKSFGLYTKSYDEMTMMYALKTSMERGSAGAFGSGVMTLEPEPSNVILKTYSDKNELQYNPNWEQTEYGVEPEVLLTGRVRVTKVVIFEPLKVETWKQTLEKMFTSVESLNNEFVSNWLRNKQDKINPVEAHNYIVELLKKILVTDEDCKKFLEQKENVLSYHIIDIKELPRLRKFLRKYLIIENNTFKIVYNNQEVRIVNNSIFDQVTKFVATPTFVKDLANMLNDVKLELYHSEHFGFSDIQVISPNTSYSDRNKLSELEKLQGTRFYQMFRLLIVNKNLIKYIKNTHFYNEIDRVVKEAENYILEFDEKDDNIEEKLDGLYKLLRDINHFSVILIDRKQIKNKIFKHLHSLIKKGPVNDKKERAINAYSKNVRHIFAFLNEKM